MREFIEKHVPKSLLQFIGFGIIGGINTVLSLLIFNGCYYFLFNENYEQLSNFIGFVITVFISFILNRTFVFKKSEDSTEESGEAKKETPWYIELIKVYVSYAFTGIFLVGILLYVEKNYLNIPLWIGSMANLIVTVPINFLLNKLWAYKNRG